MSITSTNNTICAICTASGVGSVSIVRLSGKRSKSRAEKIFSKEKLGVALHLITDGRDVAPISALKYADKLLK